MAANQNTASNRRYFKLIAKMENVDIKTKRCIVENIKKDTEYVHGEWFSSLSGFITELKTKDIEYQGKTNKIIVMELTDSSGICQLEFSFSGASYSIINSLLTADLTKEVEVSAWLKDEKYVNCSLKYAGGQKIDWEVAIADQPKPQEYQHPITKKMEKDFTNVLEFWVGKFESVRGKAVKSNFGGQIAGKSEQQTHNTSETAIYTDNPSDNLPF